MQVKQTEREREKAYVVLWERGRYSVSVRNGDRGKEIINKFFF